MTDDPKEEIRKAVQARFDEQQAAASAAFGSR